MMHDLLLNTTTLTTAPSCALRLPVLSLPATFRWEGQRSWKPWARILGFLSGLPSPRLSSLPPLWPFPSFPPDEDKDQSMESSYDWTQHTIQYYVNEVVIEEHAGMDHLYLLTYGQLFLFICFPLTLLICGFVCCSHDITPLKTVFTHSFEAFLQVKTKLFKYSE